MANPEHLWRVLSGVMESNAWYAAGDLAEESCA